jgi:acetyl-CoA carboxylase biotin carboxyl carrier protein
MAPKPDIDDKLLRKLAEILNDTGLTEVEYDSGDVRVRVAKTPAPVTVAAGPAYAAPAAAPAAAAPAAAPAKAGEAPAGTVKSPMVGTVYSASEPGKPPFVKVGDRVKEGQTLLIIEAMKVMNALPSPRAGTVTQILVSDGQPVEYGEPLLVIE